MCLKFLQFLSSIFFFLSSVSPEQDEKDLTGMPKLDTGKASARLADPATRTQSSGPQDGRRRCRACVIVITGSEDTCSVVLAQLHPRHQPAWPLQPPRHELTSTRLEKSRRGVSHGRPAARGRPRAVAGGSWAWMEPVYVWTSEAVPPAVGPRGASVSCCAS